MRISRRIIAGCIAMLGASSAGAASQTLTTTAFDISFDESVIGLFGTPTLLGDTLFFAPGGAPGFTAQTGDGIDVTNSTFAFTITAHPGFVLDSFTLVEEGDYFYFGDAAGVAVSGQLRLNPLAPGGPTLSSGLAATSFTANAALDFDTRPWSTTASIATDPLSVGQLSMQNILAAHADGDMSYAFIEKNNVELTVGVSAVPEPQTYAMMLAGLGMLGFAAGRPRRTRS